MYNVVWSGKGKSWGGGGGIGWLTGSMKETSRRRITVTSSLIKIFTDQTEIGWWREAGERCPPRRKIRLTESNAKCRYLKS